MPRIQKGKVRTFDSNQFHRIASMIRAIPDDDVREVVANHAAQWFAKNMERFDPSAWYGATGGKLTGPTRLKRAED